MKNGKLFERTHKNLDVWKNAMKLAKHVYTLTEGFPKDEIYGLTSQLRRAAVSVPSNIAEGAARTSHKEFLQFINIAQGSLSEIDTQIDLSKMLGYLDNGRHEKIQKNLTTVSKQLFGLSRSIKSQL